MTYHAYMSRYAKKGMSEKEQIELGTKAYHMVAQMIFDGGFSVVAKRTFPRIHFNFSLLSLRAWIERMNVWFGNLTEQEQELFRSLEFADEQELKQEGIAA